MIDVYFDLVSPYGYCGAMQIDKLASKYGRGVLWHPFLIGVSVMKVMGLKPLLETPIKGAYVVNDVERLGKLFNLPIYPPPRISPSPVPPARAFYWVQDHAPDLAAAFVLATYTALWRHGRDISASGVLQKIVAQLGADGEAMAAALKGEDLNFRLRSATESALARGVFGSPTFVVDGQMIWGCDRLWMLEHWLQHSGWERT